MINKLIHSSKKQYFTEYFSRNEHKSKNIWKGIRNIIYKNKTCDNEIILNDKGEIITDSKKISNKFNTYFNKVAQKLAEKNTENQQ